jgi:hypothetical protein
MDITLLYAIGLGSVLLIPLLANIGPWLPCVTFSTPSLLQRLSRSLTYPHLIRRHRFLGPWTCLDLMIQLVYIALNSFCVVFRVSDIEEAGVRAGNLSLINMVLLFLGPHLSHLADILGISLRNVRVMHRSAGLMFSSLILVHVFVMLFSQKSFPLRSIPNLSAVVVGAPNITL